jgi:hypothetical protein
MHTTSDWGFILDCDLFASHSYYQFVLPIALPSHLTRSLALTVQRSVFRFRIPLILNLSSASRLSSSNPVLYCLSEAFHLLFHISLITPLKTHSLTIMSRLILLLHVDMPPLKKRRGLAGSIVSTAVSAALIGTAVGFTVYRL